MRKLAVLTCLLLFAIPAASSDDASLSDPCDADLDTAWFESPTVHEDAAFARLLPSMTLVTTEDRSRLPTIPMFWAQGPAGVCSLDDLATVLDAHGLPLVTEAQYADAAWMIAQTTDEKVMGVQTLERVVDVSMHKDGAFVELVALSSATGTRVDWDVHVAPDGSGSATWTVREIVPGLRDSVEGWFVDTGDTGPFEPMVGIQSVEQALYPLHDGKFIRITYNTNNYANDAEAQADADRNGLGGQIAYDTMNATWGYHSADPDLYLDITLDGCACIFAGNNVNIHMPPNVMQWINNIGLGLNYQDEDGTAIDIVGHEMFHHFQYSIMQWNQANWVVEGTARMIETVHTPEYTYLPDTLVTHNTINGFNYFMTNPDINHNSHSYSYGLVWGHLQDTNNGVETIRRILEESAVNPSFPGFIDRALASEPGDHDTFAEVMADLAPRLLARDLTWDRWDGSASYAWGDLLNDVPEARLTIQGTTGAWLTNVGDYGLAFLDLGVSNELPSATVITTSGPADHEFYLVTDGSMAQVTGVGFQTGAQDKHLVVLHADDPAVPSINFLLNRVTVTGVTT